jgi:Domain of unknown function (DUF397)
MDRSSLVWRKASASNHGHNCVEVAVTSGAPAAPRRGRDGRPILVRDSKNPDGPWLTVPGSVWQALLSDIKNGGLDLR